MASRRDQLQSYQFLNQRVISALVMRETDPAQSPLRRGVGALFAGLMVAVIVAAGFGVYGLLTKMGSSNWRTDGSVVVEKESGAAYLYQGGELHPMLNYASALLASGHAPPAIVRVSRNSLAGAPRGVTLGIPYAPASLPDAGQVLSGPWSVCAAPDTDAAGNATTVSVLALSRTVPGGRRLGDAGLLVKTDKRTFLIWHGRRYEIQQPDLVLPALFGGQTSTVGVGQAWLNALPEGPPIGPIAVSRAGSRSPVPNRKVGDLLVAQTGQNPVYYLVLEDGLAQISELQKDILLGQSATQPQTISLSSANSAPKSTRLTPAPPEVRPPDRPPTLFQPATSGDAVCAESRDARSAPVVSVGGTLRDLGPGTPTESVSGAGGALADRIVVPAGHVAVVRVLESPGAPAGAYSLVTDVGLRYPVSSEAALGFLGYRTDQAVDMLADLVKLLPAGPTLDVAAAKRPADVAARPAASRPK